MTYCYCSTNSENIKIMHNALLKHEFSQFYISGHWPSLRFVQTLLSTVSEFPCFEVFIQSSEMNSSLFLSAVKNAVFCKLVTPVHPLSCQICRHVGNLTSQASQLYFPSKSCSLDTGYNKSTFLHDLYRTIFVSQTSTSSKMTRRRCRKEVQSLLGSRTGNGFSKSKAGNDVQCVIFTILAW